MKRRGMPWTKCLLTVGFLIIVGSALAHESRLPPVRRREAHIPINNFTATDQAGARFEFNRLRGKVVIVAFAYTSCPDVCPLITAAVRQVQIGLSKTERGRVQLLTVTTDPEIDSPHILAAYAARYNADLDNWFFLTGSEEELRRVWKNFGVGVKRKGRGLVDHTPLVGIVDPKGLLRFAYVGPSPDPKQLLGDVRYLLGSR